MQRDGVAVKVVFMDTEGFGAAGKVTSGDPKLAFLATAFSSMLYYNVLESINMVRAWGQFSQGGRGLCIHRRFRPPTHDPAPTFPCPPPSWQDNVRFLHTVAQLSDVFSKQYGAEYPSPAVTWVVQNFGLDLGRLRNPTPDG